MSYTNPHGFPQGNPLETKNQLANLIREMKVGELVAIKDYTMHIKQVNNMEVKKELKHIRDEEIEHFNKLNDLVLKLDMDFKEAADELSSEYKYKYHKALQVSKDEQFELMETEEDTINATMCNILADIKGEEEAIISYETSLETIEASDKDNKFKEFIDTIKEIVKDEKEHILELTELYSELVLGIVVKADTGDNTTETPTTKSLTEDKMAILSPHIKQIKQYLMDNYPNYKDMSLTMFIDDEDNARTMISEVRTDFITK